MKILLDTHAFLWWMENNPTLSKQARKAIEDPSNMVFVSAITVLEIAIKKSIGKLTAPDNLEEELVNNNFEQLPITIAHAQAVGSLPFHHADPFDRVLIAQTQIEGLTLISRDNNIKKYGITIVDA